MEDLAEGQTAMRDIEVQASRACINHLAKSTVAIVNSIRTVGTSRFTGRPGDTEEPGTGCAARWGRHHFILTAGHVVDNAKVSDLRIHVSPSEGFAFKDPSMLTTKDIVDALPIRDTGVVVHRCDSEDLALLTVDPAVYPGLEFIHLESDWKDPDPGEMVHCCGFPSDHSVTVDRAVIGNRENVSIAIYPTIFDGVVLPPPTDSERTFKFPGFDPARHYLVPYEASSVSQHPRGFSGAAAWWEHDEKRIIWAARFKFAGVCTSAYKKGTVVEVVKASAVRVFLEKTFGPVGSRA